MFEMFDITNLKSPDAYRSTSLDVQFLDDGSPLRDYHAHRRANARPGYAGSDSNGDAAAWRGGGY